MFKQIRAFLLLRKAQKYFHQWDDSKVIAMLEHIVSITPWYHFAYYHLARKFLEMQEFQKARENITKAIQYQPENSVYHTFLGIVLYEQKNYGESRASLERALALDAQNQLIHNYLALCYLGEADVNSFQNILQEKGIFESTDFQIRLIMAMETYLRKYQAEKQFLKNKSEL